ncbi:MAG: lipoate--protein ligase family protein [Candidatus Omnitrophica bacterium]|nr:lipoate--protein ligase family protein [Candidatus Omnitrophota bacterium]MDD5430358.1 lipoate--protein ligase family protein [Candidatus Omnitrophota bacterium]
MSKRWRLIIENKNDGYYNMAVDEALLFSYSVHKIPTLRIYGWDKPFISLGYNQDPVKVLNPLIKIPVVRRITGGSVIVHDKEITYSIVCGPGDLELTGPVKESYRQLCSFLKIFYLKLGLTAEFAQDVPGRQEKIFPASDFCFMDRQQFDLMIGAKKIGGNAQRRRRDSVFQHGSIPQRVDFSLLSSLMMCGQSINSKTCGLDDLLKQGTDFCKLQVMLAESFSEAFSIKLSQEKMPSKEEKLSSMFLRRKYTSCDWNYKRIFKPAGKVIDDLSKVLKAF